MKYVAVYAVTYAAGLLLGYYSPGMSEAAVVGMAHLAGLMGALCWWLAEIAAVMNKNAFDLSAFMREIDEDDKRIRENIAETEQHIRDGARPTRGRFQL